MCFLIREPERVLASYAEKTETVCAADIGFTRQRELFDLVRTSTGKTPAVVDAHDIRSNPQGVLRSYVKRLGLIFTLQC